MTAKNDTRPVLTLIDGTSYIFRAYHAIPHLTNGAGLPTNAIYGFTNMVLKALRERSPTHVAMALDKDARAYRQTIDPEYKAHRPPAPDELVVQFPHIYRVLEALDLPVVELAGYEADDVIATLAREAVAEGFQVLVITGDKDLMQLVGPHVELFDPMSERHTREPDVLERLGVMPAQVIEYMALIGDPVDNVPGVPKVGPKTASALISHFGTVEALLARLDEVASLPIRGAKGLAPLLAEHAEQIGRAHKLVSLRDDLELGVRPTQLGRRPPKETELRALFTEFGFTRLLRELGTLPAASEPPPRPKAKPSPEALPGSVDAQGTATIALSRHPVDCQAVLTREALDQLARRLRESAGFALHTLCAEGRGRRGALTGLAFALDGGAAWYVPVGRSLLGQARQLSDETLFSVLGPLLSAADLPKYGHGLKSDYLALRQRNISLGGLACDAELASYLLAADQREHSLEALARARLGGEFPADPCFISANRRRRGDELSIEELAPYAGACAASSAALARPLLDELKREGLLELNNSMELPLMPILGEMELAGVLLDRKALRAVGDEVERALREQELAIAKHGGSGFNVNSNAQLARVLFDQLGLPVQRRGKTGPSVDQEVLEKLAELHPLPRQVLDYRALAKLKSTYLDALPELLGTDGRIHTSFHQAIAATGRLSSSDPNLQNIPIRTPLGRRVREAFVAPEGMLLVSADYSQIELRVLAHISGDEALIAAFNSDEDVHTRTASEIFGVPTISVTPEMRRAAKAVNFGIAYGLSPFGLGQRLGIPPGEAKQIIDSYFARYRGVRAWLDRTVEEARREGFVSTLYHRKRHVPEILGRQANARQGAERIAVNMPIQGTAADLMKLAMLDFCGRLKAERLSARLLLQVHDELVVEAPEGEVARVKELLVSSMSGVAKFAVPLTVEVGSGKSWATAH